VVVALLALCSIHATQQQAKLTLSIVACFSLRLSQATIGRRMNLIHFDDDVMYSHFPNICGGAEPVPQNRVSARNGLEQGFGGCASVNKSSDAKREKHETQTPWMWKPPGWWCAQKRHIASVTLLLNKYVFGRPS
jgi:hypothetical protein